MDEKPSQCDFLGDRQSSDLKGKGTYRVSNPLPPWALRVMKIELK